MHDEETFRKEAKKLLKSFDETIEKGPWDKSAFLRAIGKKLEDIRLNFKTRLKLDAEENATMSSSEPIEKKTPPLQEGRQEVFVLLYNAEGGNLKKWEKILQLLDKQIVTRPVYGQESEIRTLIRSKMNKQNEAYASVFINMSALLPLSPGHVLKDRLGHSLLLLKDGAFHLENITHLFHQSGVYMFTNGHLVRERDLDFSDFN